MISTEAGALRLLARDRKILILSPAISKFKTSASVLGTVMLVTVWFWQFEDVGDFYKVKKLNLLKENEHLKKQNEKLVSDNADLNQDSQLIKEYVPADMFPAETYENIFQKSYL